MSRCARGTSAPPAHHRAQDTGDALDGDSTGIRDFGFGPGFRVAGKVARRPSAVHASNHPAEATETPAISMMTGIPSTDLELTQGQQGSVPGQTASGPDSVGREPVTDMSTTQDTRSDSMNHR